MPGVVADEKDIFLNICVFLSIFARYCRTVEVLAVPGPPMKQTARPWPMARPIVYSLRVESIVGMSSEANCSATEPPGPISHLGIIAPQCDHSPVASSTLYS